MSNKTKFAKLSPKDQKIVWHANGMLWLWRELNQRDTKGQGWYEQKARQAYHDCLLSLRHNGLIEGYDCVSVRTKIDGEWYSERKQLSFVPTKSASTTTQSPELP